MSHKEMLEKHVMPIYTSLLPRIAENASVTAAMFTAVRMNEGLSYEIALFNGGLVDVAAVCDDISGHARDYLNSRRENLLAVHASSNSDTGLVKVISRLDVTSLRSAADVKAAVGQGTVHAIQAGSIIEYRGYNDPNYNTFLEHLAGNIVYGLTNPSGDGRLSIMPLTHTPQGKQPPLEPFTNA